MSEAAERKPKSGDAMELAAETARLQKETEPTGARVLLDITFPNPHARERFVHELLPSGLNLAGIGGTEIGKRVRAFEVEASEDGGVILNQVPQVGPRQ